MNPTGIRAKYNRKAKFEYSKEQVAEKLHNFFEGVSPTGSLGTWKVLPIPNRGRHTTDSRKSIYATTWGEYMS